MVVLLLAGCQMPGTGDGKNDPTASESGSSGTGGGSSANTATDAPTATSTPVPPTPTPTPTPPPPPLARCYQPRPPAAPATPVAEASPPLATPEASPTEPPVVLRPAGAHSLFQSCQVIAYYGFPDEPRMGILGTADPETVIQKLKEQADAYDKVNGRRGVALALHVIYAVAQDQDYAGDGTYLYRMPDSTVEQYIALAEQHDLLLFLDIQMGHSTVEAELPHVLPFLKNPRVHLGLDPEFATGPDEAPGTVIGGMDASEINKAQDALQKLVDDERLPNKILVVHQFRPTMIRDKAQLKSVPGVDLVIDIDGFGDSQVKIDGYTLFVKDDNAEHGGFKLFYDQDTDLMTPDQVEHLDPQPDVVIYQ